MKYVAARFMRKKVCFKRNKQSRVTRFYKYPSSVKIYDITLPQFLFDTLLKKASVAFAASLQSNTNKWGVELKYHPQSCLWKML